MNGFTLEINNKFQNTKAIATVSNSMKYEGKRGRNICIEWTVKLNFDQLSFADKRH